MIQWLGAIVNIFMGGTEPMPMIFMGGTEPMPMIFMGGTEPMPMIYGGDGTHAHDLYEDLYL